MRRSIDSPAEFSVHSRSTTDATPFAGQGKSHQPRIGFRNPNVRGNVQGIAQTISSQKSISITDAKSVAKSPARLRVLLIADGCNPQMTSVPLEGYCHSEALRKIADVLVVTHVRNRTDLTAAGWKEGKDFICIDTEAISRWSWKIITFIRGGSGTGWTTLAALTIPLYYLFEHKLWAMLGSRIIAGEFDIVHRLIPLSPVAPSLLAARCQRHGIPFIVGPLNGGLPWPPGFSRELRKEREWLAHVRDFHKLLPGYRSTRSLASAIIVGSCDAMRQMPRDCRNRCFYIPENAVEPKRFPDSARNTERPAGPLRVVFIGRLVPYKGADMLIEAAADLLREEKMILEIVGDGPQMAELRELVVRLNLTDRVNFLGWLDHRQLSPLLERSDVMAFPSIREFGGAVVIEAMAAGVVPIVINYGGPAELVTQQTGFTVESGNREQIIERFSKTLRQICETPKLVYSRSEPARKRARTHFAWDAKASQVMEVYRWVLGKTKVKPAFPMPIPDGGGQ